jgi:hypothetical protein
MAAGSMPSFFLSPSLFINFLFSDKCPIAEIIIYCQFYISKTNKHETGSFTFNNRFFCR